jgi:hypothetical protein
MAEVKAPPKGTRSRIGAEAASTPPPPICSVAFCPICTVVTAIGEVRPDLMEHLLVAGREVLLGLRALIDARLEGSGSAPTKMEHLTIG